VDPLYLSADFPRLYHVAEVGSWPSIERHGLLSTTALLDLFELNGEERRQLEEEHRPESVPIAHAEHGVAVIRDQKPLSMTRLASCLVGMTSTEWLRQLNRLVFFWPTEKRLGTFLQAGANRDRPHDVLVIDTRALVERHEREISLSAINSGATGRAGAPRGPNTFQSLRLYDYDSPRLRRRGIAEVAVDYAVPDIGDMVLRIERHQRQ
jgi:hypothetical protein